MKLLLDTNVYSAWKRGDKKVAARLQAAERLYLSVVVMGELVFGFRNGTRAEINAAELEEFVRNPYVTTLPVTVATSHWYGRIAANLRRNGTPVPTNDIWIAAHAMETGAELLSLDAHFGFIENLSWSRPA